MQNNMKTVAILTGGQSSEREIALASAKTVEQELRRYYDVEVFDFPNDLDRFLDCRDRFVCCVPVFHGKGGEDGVIQGFLKTLHIPFIFSQSHAHAIGMDKVVTKQLVREVGLHVAEDPVVDSAHAIQIDLPFVIKPISDGSSIGVEICRDQVPDIHTTTMVERYLEGREFTVPVIDHNGKAQALPVIEIRSKNDFFDFESKYNAELVEEICPAEIPEELAEELSVVALKAHDAIGARHLTRSDMIVDKDGKIWFLEINTIPGLTINSLVPKSVRAAGLHLGDLLKQWIEDVQ